MATDHNTRGELGGQRGQPDRAGEAGKDELRPAFAQRTVVSQQAAQPGSNSPCCDQPPIVSPFQSAGGGWGVGGDSQSSQSPVNQTTSEKARPAIFLILVKKEF